MTERRSLQVLGLGFLLAAIAAMVVGHDGGRVVGLDDPGFARLAYGAAVVLVVFALVMVGGAAFRRHLRAATIWFGIGFLLVVGYGLRTDISDAGNRLLGVLLPGRAVEVGDSVVVSRRSGHPFVIDARVNGTDIDMLLDTGASATTLTAQDARAVGIKTGELRYDEIVLTANGPSQVASVRLDAIEIGSIRLENVQAYVTTPGALETSLLGMNALERLSSIQLSADEVVLNP